MIQARRRDLNVQWSLFRSIDDSAPRDAWPFKFRGRPADGIPDTNRKSFPIRPPERSINTFCKSFCTVLLRPLCPTLRRWRHWCTLFGESWPKRCIILLMSNFDSCVLMDGNDFEEGSEMFASFARWSDKIMIIVLDENFLPLPAGIWMGEEKIMLGLVIQYLFITWLFNWSLGK